LKKKREATKTTKTTKIHERNQECNGEGVREHRGRQKINKKLLQLQQQHSEEKNANK